MLLKIILLECTFANRQQEAEKTHGRKAEKETCAEEKRASLGEALEKGFLIFIVCAVLSNPCRVAGTSGLWSSGRPTPNGGARNGAINKKQTYSII